MWQPQNLGSCHETELEVLVIRTTTFAEPLNPTPPPSPFTFFHTQITSTCLLKMHATSPTSLFLHFLIITFIYNLQIFFHVSLLYFLIITNHCFILLTQKMFTKNYPNYFKHALILACIQYFQLIY